MGTVSQTMLDYVSGIIVFDSNMSQMLNGFSFKTIELEVGNSILGLVIIPTLKRHWRISPVIILEDSLVSFKVRS